MNLLVVFLGRSGLFLLVTIAATIAVAVSTPTTPAATSTTATTATLEAVPLTIIPALSVSTITVTATATTTATAAPTILDLALVENLTTVRRVELSLFDELVLLLDIGNLLHDLQLSAMELRGRIQGEESIGFRLAVELDKDGALELVIIVAPELAMVNRAVLAKEGLNIELGRLRLFTEALGVDAAQSALLLSVARRHVGLRASNRLLALLALDYKLLALAKGGNNGGIGLELTHPLEAANGLERNGLVLGAASGTPQELVARQVAVAEIELDLQRQ